MAEVFGVGRPMCVVSLEMTAKQMTLAMIPTKKYIAMASVAMS
jgi:hypothetical protein